MNDSTSIHPELAQPRLLPERDPAALRQETDMLDKVKRGVATAQRAEPLDVAILSVATAVPPHVLSQADVAARAVMISPQFARLDSLFANTGIETRYVCETA